MSGFEIAGIALAVPGVVGQLLKISLEGYRVFSNAQSLDEDYSDYRHRFELADQNLRDWAKQNSHEIKDMDENRKRLVINTLSIIARIFASVERMGHLYGLEEDPDPGPGVPKPGKDPKPSKLRNPFKFSSSLSPSSSSLSSPKRSSWNRHRFSRSKAHLVPGEASAVSLAEFIVKLDINVEPSELDNMTRQLESAVSAYARAKWAFTDREKLGELLVTLERYNRNLYELTGNGRLLELSRAPQSGM